MTVSPAAALAAGDPNAPRSIPAAAREFEALLIGQMLKAAATEWGCGEDQAGGIARDFAQEQFARALAARGSFGIADLVTRNVNPPPASPATSPP